MPGTVDDFMSRFGGNQTVDDREAAQYHDRFVSPKLEDRDFDNRTYHQSATEYRGNLPDDEFQQAARSAVAQAPPEEREGLLGGLLDLLAGSGGGLGAIASMLGLGSTDPNKMSEEDAARVMNYARRERPEAQKVVEEKPWLVKAKGNPLSSVHSPWLRPSCYKTSVGGLYPRVSSRFAANSPPAPILEGSLQITLGGFHKPGTRRPKMHAATLQGKHNVIDPRLYGDGLRQQAM